MNAAPLAPAAAVAPSLRAKVIAGLLWSVFTSWGGRLLSLATFVVLVRYVGPPEVGLLAAAMVVLNFAELFVEQGFVSAIVQRREITPEQLGAAFVVNIALGALVFAALAAGAPWIARAMRVEGLAPILPWAAFVIPLRALGFCQLAMAQRQFAYKALAGRTLLAQAISAVVAIALAVQGAGVWALVAQALLNAGLTSALLWVGPQWRPQRPLDFAGVRSMAGYSVNILGTRIVDYGNRNGAPLLIAASVGPTGLGLYTVGVRVYETLLGLFTSAVTQVAHSGFSRLAHDPVRLAEAHRRAVACTALVALPAFTLTAIAAPELVQLLFGSAWLPSVPVMQAMALLGAAQSVQFFNGNALNAIGRPHLSLLLNIIKLCAGVASLLLTRGEPLAIIAWSFVSGQLAVSPLGTWLARRHVGISLRAIARALAPSLLASLAMLAVGLALRLWPAFESLGTPARAAALLAAAGCTYATVVLLCGRESLMLLIDLRRVAGGHR